MSKVSAVLALPPTTSALRLTTYPTSYSAQWQGPSGAKHVLVDGLANGWIGPKSYPVPPRYTPAALVHFGLITTLAGLVVLATGVGASVVRRRRSLNRAGTAR
jgi:hypothetical protein